MSILLLLLILILVLSPFIVSVFLLKNNKSSIPKVIHKVYIEHSMTIPSSLPDDIKNAHNTWKVKNPGYKIKYYGGKDCEKYLLKHFGKRHLHAFRKLKPYSYKCDFFRFCVVYKEGGVYSDWKTVCHQPLDSLITSNTKWISSWDVVRPNMVTGFFVCAPKNKVLKTAIDMCLYNIENNVYGSWCLEPTGPTLFGNAFSKHYPRYKHGTPVNENGILLGTFSPTKIFFKNTMYLESKCATCGQTQDWDKGNNYVKMWLNRDIYNEIY